MAGQEMQGPGLGGQPGGRGVRMAQMQPDDLQLDIPSPARYLPASGEQVILPMHCSPNYSVMIEQVNV